MGNGERFSLTLKTLVRRQNSTRKTRKQNDVPGERKKAFQSVRPMMTCLFPQFHPQLKNKGIQGQSILYRGDFMLRRGYHG